MLTQIVFLFAFGISLAPTLIGWEELYCTLNMKYLNVDITVSIETFKIMKACWRNSNNGGETPDCAFWSSSLS